MAVTVKHSKVSTIPDDADTSLVRPSDWNADHTLVGTIDVPNGGTGATTLTGYVKGNGTSAMTAVATVPSTDITGLGTMSTQNANAVAITGGTINGTTIGATTPSTVNATTLSGQTGVLRGTGQNLFLYSEQFNNAAWTKTNVSITADSLTAPDGTTTADTVTASAGASTHDIDPLQASFFGMTSGFTYVISVYAKKGTNNFFQICVLNQNTDFANFDLNNGTVGTTGGAVTSSITSVGDGWYRCSILITVDGTTRRPCFALVPSSSATRRESWTAAGTETVYLWGAQLELGSSLGVYTQTVASTVFNTQRISFNGVSTIGLQSNGALFLQPAGTGAIQAQQATSTTAGGNVRGANAVDWQTLRTSAGQVASAIASTIAGGTGNTASGSSTVVAGGNSNTALGSQSAVLGGFGNNASGIYSSIAGGFSNTAAGYLNFIGGGQLNSGTAIAAVTTQSGTMNATTAVTLSGSNANIRVGQYITGTSIATNTYVAAISGTSLTLSQAASGSSTSTLSFFTPHGVVVGGGNNQATGSYSFIGGGGDAGTAANRNVASGDWSFVGGGGRNTASGVGSVICGGGNFGSGFSSNVANGTSAFLGAGYNNNSAGFAGSILGGVNNVQNGNFGSVLGGASGSTRGIIANFAFPSGNPLSSNSAFTQAALLVLAVQTTDATATALRSDTTSAGTTNQVILPNNSAYFFRGEVVSGVTGGGNTKGWFIEGVIKRGANAASTALVGTPTVTSNYADAGASTWTIAVTADTTNGGLAVTFTGQASTTIRTVAQIRTTEMTY